MRFELIDRVVSREGDSLKAVKVVTLAEESLADHFPDFPVLPGVLMLEALAQAARAYVAALNGSEATGSTEPAAQARPLVVSEVKNLRYGQMVRPGEALSVEVTCRKQTDGGWEFQGTGTVGQELAVQGRFTLAPLPD